MMGLGSAMCGARVLLKMASLLLMLITLVSFCSGFNIDLPSRVVHASDQPDSMFGFAVAMHKDRQGVSRLLVGAPRYNTEQSLRGVRRGGAVLKCSSELGGSCEYVPFDRTGHHSFLFGQTLNDSTHGFAPPHIQQGNNMHPLGEQLDEKSFQWFGATLRSSRDSSVVVACAPRYIWFTENLRRREPVGTCYIARNDLTDFQEYSPCRTRQWGYHRQGSCQAGFDAALSQDGDRLFMGAPGAFYWQGQIHSQNLLQRNEYVRTGEGPAIDDDQYLGYSVAAGDFTGDGIADVALGVPKGLNYTGKIAIYSHDLINLQNITGYQLGSYFGYCLTVTDFNQDGRDDIIVGSPLYTDYNDKEMKYEVGRVHVLLQNSVHRFQTVVTLEGQVSKARFGLSVAALGDINMDGYNDIAVGAPYGGPDGQGAVFIYHGFAIRSGENRDLEKEKPAQVIYSADVAPRMSTFGWSVSGGVDMDNNLYPDLVVGAYLANTAVMLKTRPIVSMVNHTLRFKTEGRTLNIEQTTCTTRTGSPVPCVDLQLCLSYSGVGVGPQAELDVKYALDSKVNEPRMFFVQNDNRILHERVLMYKDAPVCKDHQVYALPSLKDKLSPLTAEVSYSLVGSQPPLQRRRRNAPLQPILNQKQPLLLQDAITIQKNCGPDNVCVPDLILTVEAPQTYVLGKPEQLSINVRVTNNAEDAFEASVFIPVPPGLLYNKFVQRENTSVTCSPRKRDGQTVILCDVGNPLPQRKGVVFDVLFQQAGNLEKPNFAFLVIANSTNKEADHTLEDNVVSTNIVVNVDTELILYGNSEPEMLEYNLTQYPEGAELVYEEDLGPQIIHKYGLSNKGPSDVLQVDIVILWPSKTLEGNHLLYLLEQPFTSGPVVCDTVPGLNPLKLELFNRGETYKRLKLSSNRKSQSSSSSSSGTIGSQYASSSSSGGSGGGSSSSHYEYSESSGSGVGGGGYSGGATVVGGGGGAAGGGSRSSSSYSSSSSGGGGNYSSSYYSSSSSSRSSSSSSSGYKTDSALQNQIPHQQRFERSAEDPELDWDNEVSSCGATDCTIIKCSAGPLEEGDDLYVYLRSRVLLHTLQEDPMFPYKDVQISSRMVARVRRLPQRVNPDFLKVRSLTVSSPVSPAVSLDSPPPIPWWIIVLATLVGLIILLIIILILWKCGYFKRNRPKHGSSSTDEASRPLHSNGRAANGGQNGSSSNGRNGHASNGRNGHHSYNKPLYPGDEAL